MNIGSEQSSTPGSGERKGKRLPKKRGPKPENGIKRVRLLKCGPFVKQETEAILLAWKNIHGIAPGRALDQVIAYVSKDPGFEIKSDSGISDFNGGGVQKSDAEAVKSDRLAAEQGNVLAQHNLGNRYSEGLGVPKDRTEAVRWYRLAAYQDHDQAQFNLGSACAYGRGVPKDFVQAHAWWNIAGAKGREDAKTNLATVEKQMTSEQKAEAMKLAREIFARIEAKEK